MPDLDLIKQVEQDSGPSELQPLPWTPAFAKVTRNALNARRFVGHQGGAVVTDLLQTIEDGIAWLTLNRPDRLNAFSPAMLLGLGEALQRLGEDGNVGAVVITGAGRGFCAGGDVKTMPARAAQGFEERVEGLRRMHQLPMLLRTVPKVVIAMVNGPAVGAGLGLAMACDLRIAGRSARFGTGFAGVGYSGAATSSTPRRRENWASPAALSTTKGCAMKPRPWHGASPMDPELPTVT
jgi:hypothetical protein